MRDHERRLSPNLRRHKTQEWFSEELKQSTNAAVIGGHLEEPREKLCIFVFFCILEEDTWKTNFPLWDQLWHHYQWTAAIQRQIADRMIEAITILQS